MDNSSREDARCLYPRPVPIILPSGAANNGTLKPGQSSTVPFTICLATRNRFQFTVDVYGNTVSAR